MENEENQKPVSHRFPQPLEIANDAIPTFPQPRRGAEKWKTQPRFPTFPLVVYFSRKGEPGGRFAPLQAHSSIRKCSKDTFRTGLGKESAGSGKRKGVSSRY